MKREALGTVQKQDLTFPLHALRCDGRSVVVRAHCELPSMCLHPKARVLLSPGQVELLEGVFHSAQSA